MKELKVLALIFLVSAFSFSQSINITFQVDMSVQIFEGNFPAGANVVVRGNFQTAFGDSANWYGGMFPLSDADGDTIYTGTFNAPASLAGNSYIFKYVIVNPPAGDNWESTPDREFTITPPSTVISKAWFNNDSIIIPCFGVTNTLNITADITDILGVGISGAFDPNQDSLLVMGLDWDNLGKNLVGNRRMIYDNILPGIYTTTLTVTSGSAAPNGVGDSTKWKFKAFPDERFQDGGWETGPDRWHIYIANGSTVTLPTIIPRILPFFPPTQLDVDLTINVDMTSAINRYNGELIPLNELEFVGIIGSEIFLGDSLGACWCPTDTSTGNMKVLTHISANIWSYHTIIPVGTITGEKWYKFAAMYPGADTINSGVLPLDNESNESLWPPHRFSLSGQLPAIVLNNFFGLHHTDVERIEDLVPSDYKLEQNYPNPFNPSTKIRYSIPEYSFVNLKVFNLLGEEIETIVNSEQSAGVYEATFDANILSSGIYFYTLNTSNFSFTKKMLLVR